MSNTTADTNKESKTEYTNFDAAKKAKDIAAPIEEKSKQRRKTLLENAAAIISVFAIFLTVILFAYNKGFSSVFNVPVRCMPLDLKSYIPVAFIVGGILTTAFYYSALSKTEIALKKVRVNPIRILYGFIILQYFLIVIHFDYYLGKIWSLLAPALISLAIELILFLLRRPKKTKNISKAEYKIRVEDYIFDRVFFFQFVKTGLWVAVLAIILAPFIGKISAKANTDYEICEYNGGHYSVIVDYGERVLAQKSLEKDNTLIICTDEYTYIPKDGIVFVFKHYDSVKIVAELPITPDFAAESEQHEG